MTSIDDVMIEITPQVLLKAYACGIFPMAESAEDNALYWIEPERRGILPLDRVHVPKRLARTIRGGGFEVKIDRNFEAVIDGCAAPRSGRRSTWINGRIRGLYRELFALGHCHTVEVWQDGALIGGLYGVHLGRAFFGESMFSQSPRREQDRARLSRRAIEIWGIHPARHPVRYRASGAVRRDRGEPRRVSAIPRGRVRWRLGPRKRLRRSCGGRGRLGRLGRRCRGGGWRLGRRRRRGRSLGAGVFSLLSEGAGAETVLQLVSQTSKTGCSTA